MTVTTLPVFSLKLFKRFCPSSTIPGGTVPNPSDNWLPVADTVVTLPTAPPIVTAPETIPGNSAPVDGCFDPDNVDYSQIFNNLLPQEDVDGTYDESLNTGVLIQGKNEIIPIRGVTRLVFGLITSKYDLTPKFTDVVLRTRSIIATYRLKAAVDAEEASYSLGGQVIGLTRQKPPLLAKKGAYTLLMQPAVLVGPSQQIFSVEAGVFSVNPLRQVLLLSHFDSDFDEQTGNTVGYNWWYTQKPEIIATSKFGGGALSCDSITYNSRYLFTYLNPAVVTQDIPTWTIEAWVYLDNDESNTIPVGFTADGHPDGMSFYLYAYKYSTVSGSEASVSFWYENNSVRVAILDSYVPTSSTSGWHHIALSFTGAAYRVYFDGAILSHSQSGLTDLPFQYPSDGVTSPVNVKSGITVGSVPVYAGQQAFFYVRTYVDEVRLVEGLVTETGTFPVPTEPYTTEPLGTLSANLYKITSTAADAASFTLTGQAISFASPSKVFKAESASFTLTGQTIVLYKPSTVLLASVGSYTVSGQNTAPIPTLVGSAQGVTSTGDLSVAWPTGYAAGDVGIMITESSSQNAASRPITPPYGWSPLDGWPQDDTNSYCSVFYKVAKASEPSVFLPRIADHQIVILSVFRYVDLVDPIVTAEGSVTTSSNGNIVYPAVTGVIPSTLLVEFRTNHQDSLTSETDTGRSNTHPAWSDGGLIARLNTSSGDGGGVTVYQASTRWGLSSGLPGTTATSTRGFGLRTLGTLVLRPKGWLPPVLISITAEVGSYNVNDQAIGLYRQVQLSANAVAYTLTGSDVYLGAPPIIFPAAEGAYTLTGQAAGSTYTRGIAAAAGGFTAAGQDAILGEPDAVAYVAAVQVADSQVLEPEVANAYSKFIWGCKSDGIWTAIKASCIMAGARTLAGALTPLVGTAPTNNNFVAGDYNRRTGLVGDGSTKYLDSNRASNADPQNSLHQAVSLSSAGTTTTFRTHIGTTFSGTTNADFTDILALNDNRLVFRNRNGNATLGINFFAAPAGSTTGFLGSSRAASNNFDLRYAGSTSNVSSSPQNISYTPSTANHLIFARNGSPPTLFSDARISFYSIGESLDLALLDSRVTTLMADIAAAIP